MSERPNVLVVMSDEQNWDTLGCNGNPAAVTPNLDELSGESTSFDRTYTPYPLCCPSRASLLTGRMPHEHGVLGNWRPIRDELREAGLANSFAAEGYHTIYTGKWHVPGTTPARMGWQDTSAIPAVLDGRDRGRFIPDYRAYVESLGYRLDPQHIENLTAEDIAATTGPGSKPYATASIPLEHYLETWQTGQFLDALDRRPRDRPWLAMCSFNAPHFPMIVPAPYDCIVDRDRVELPQSWATGLQGKPRQVRESRYARDVAGLDEHDWRELISHYWGLCALVDTQFGRIRRHLEETGEWERTIVVFTSDHGDMMGAHRLAEKGHPLHYEPTLRVPLLIRHPDADAARSTALMSVCDISATLAELAGVEWDSHPDSRSFTAHLGSSSAPAVRTHVISESVLADGAIGGHGEPFHASDWSYPRDDLNLSVRMEQERYVFRASDVEELYDLSTDPAEQVNVADDPARRSRCVEFRQLLADAVGDSFAGASELLGGAAGGA